MYKTDELARQSTAIEKRLRHLDQFGRQDIHLFARAAQAVAFNGARVGELSEYLSVWEERIASQTALESHFPPGVRLSTFAHSPVMMLSQIRADGHSSVPIRPGDIETWLWNCVGKPDIRDTQLERFLGLRIGALSNLLSGVFHSDPVSFFHLISFELEATASTGACLYPAVPYGKRGVRRPFHSALPIANIMRMIAEWRRIVQLFTHLNAMAVLDHIRFAELSNWHPITEGLKGHEAYRLIVDSMPLPVPMLRGIIDDPHDPIPAMLRELNRVLEPANVLGARKRRQLFHFHGLDAADVLLLGLFELVCAARGIPSGGDPRPGAPIYFGDNDLLAFAEAYASTWPSLIAELTTDRANRIRAVRKVYTKTDGIIGDTFRFDPECWLDPESDVPILRKLATVRGDHAGYGFYSSVGVVRDCLQSMLCLDPSRMDLGFGLRVAALLMCGANVSTRDPTYLLLLEHALVKAGFRNRRNSDQAKLPEVAVNTANYLKPFGCSINPVDIRGRQYPMLPKKGERGLGFR